MNENENNFDGLRRLLTLKRHEVPPPGYFENFPGTVRSRLRAGEEGRGVDFAERMAVELPWLFRLLSAFEAKPAFAGGFASVLCLLLLGGIVYAERPDAAPQPLLLSAAQSDVGVTALPADAKPLGLDAQPAMTPVALAISSTNPVFNTSGTPSLFNPQAGLAQQVSFSLPGN